MITRRRVLAGSALSLLPMGFSAANARNIAGTPWLNWSGDQRCIPKSRVSKLSEEQLASFMGSNRDPIRPVGSGHSFSPLVPTEGHIMVVDHLRGLKRQTKNSATFGAGTLLSDMGPLLTEIGRSLHNLPDIDRQTLAGAISTATHGTGLSFGSLSSYVKALRMILPNGAIKEITPNDNKNLFDAARVSLGTMGLITEITMATQPAHKLKATTQVEDLRQAINEFDSKARKHKHYELFPFTYSNYTLTLGIDDTNENDFKSPEDPNADQAFLEVVAMWYQTPAEQRVPLVDAVVETLDTEIKIGPSHDVLTNIRNSRFNEMEYTVSVENGAACLQEILDTIIKDKIDVVYPLEYRYVKGDDTWLGMFAGAGEYATISAHQIQGRAYQPFFDHIEPIFWKYGGRPHWGKLHTLGKQQLAKLYPRFDDFCALRKSIDPEGKLLNPHLRKLFL